MWYSYVSNLYTKKEKEVVRKARSHVTIDIPEDIKFLWKMHALKRHMTMRDWLIAITADAIRREEQLNK